MIKVKNFFGHLKTILIHKYWVFYYCNKIGMPLVGLRHDLSKFSPIEFFEGVKYWDGHRSPIDVCKEQNNGLSYAWLHHKGRNRHHVEYWFDTLHTDAHPHKMPNRYLAELICDYLGAGRAYMGKDFSYEAEYEWWKKKRLTIKMDEQNINKINAVLSMFVANEEFGFIALRSIIKT